MARQKLISERQWEKIAPLLPLSSPRNCLHFMQPEL
jgi:hypothetical protein